MTFFTYNGISSENFGLHIESKDIYSAPEYDVDFNSIPGRNGDLLISNSRFNNLKVSYTVFLARENTVELAKTIRGIKSWLYKEPDRYHLITDSYDTGYVRYGVIKGNLDIAEQLNRVGSFTVTFSCKPFRYSETGFEDIIIPSSGSVITNPEGFDASPVITIDAGSSFSLTVQNVGYNKTWSFSDINGKIICDSEQMNFYYDTSLLNDRVTGDGFPILPPGDNIISWAGDVTAVTVKPGWCTL